MKSMLMACFLALQMPFAFAEWSGVVEQVVSGDTIKVNYEGHLYSVKLYGVAAPKLNQPYGTAAKEATRNLVLGRSVTVNRIYADGATDVGVVYVHDQYSVQAYLAGSGLAWVQNSACSYEYCAKWQSMENQARNAGRGLWSRSNPIPPWNWGAKTQGAKKKIAPKYMKKSVKKAKKRRVSHQPKNTEIMTESLNLPLNETKEQMQKGEAIVPVIQQSKP